MNYAARARIHEEYVKKHFVREVYDSVRRSTLFFSSFRRPEVDPHGRRIGLLRASSSEALHILMSKGAERDNKIAILNFASYKRPGGEYLNGATSQEEALCHESTLYQVISSFQKPYYDYNNSVKNKGLYLNAAIYSPDIIFMHGPQIYKADVLTCAAPNWNAASRFGRASRQENLDALVDRVDFMYAVAQQMGVQTLIAGAWGCGVFGQNPEVVCQLLVNNPRRPEKLMLAVPTGRNYDVFKEVLDKEKERRK